MNLNQKKEIRLELREEVQAEEEILLKTELLLKPEKKISLETESLLKLGKGFTVVGKGSVITITEVWTGMAEVWALSHHSDTRRVSLVQVIS